MNAFGTAKIGFAIALLAALFTVHPLIVASADLTFSLLGYTVRLIWFYYTAMGLFCAAVYLYALAFISDRVTGFVERAGNLLYTCALLVPPIYILLLGFSIVGSALAKVAPYLDKIVTAISGMLVAAFATFAGITLSRIINKRDRESQFSRLWQTSRTGFFTAESYFDYGHFNSAIYHGLQAIENALKAVFLRRKIPVAQSGVTELLEQALSTGVLPPNLKDDVDSLCRFGAKAAVYSNWLEKDETTAAMETIRDILGLVAQTKKKT